MRPLRGTRHEVPSQMLQLCLRYHAPPNRKESPDNTSFEEAVSRRTTPEIIIRMRGRVFSQIPRESALISAGALPEGSIVAVKMEPPISHYDIGYSLGVRHDPFGTKSSADSLCRHSVGIGCDQETSCVSSRIRDPAQLNLRKPFQGFSDAVFALVHGINDLRKLPQLDAQNGCPKFVHPIAPSPQAQ